MLWVYATAGMRLERRLGFSSQVLGAYVAMPQPGAPSTPAPATLYAREGWGVRAAGHTWSSGPWDWFDGSIRGPIYLLGVRLDMVPFLGKGHRSRGDLPSIVHSISRRYLVEIWR